MLTPTYDELRRCLYALDESAVKRLIRGVLGGDYVPTDSVELLRQLQILIADWLAHLGVLTDAQQHMVITRFAHTWDKYFVHTLSGLGDHGGRPGLTFAVSDCRWISCTYHEGFFDVEDCLMIPELPEVAVTHIMCDVTALYVKTQHRLVKIRQNLSKDAAHGNSVRSDGSTAGLANDQAGSQRTDHGRTQP